jgi:DNA uptake protein ComE-like DNA-binding protein
MRQLRAMGFLAILVGFGLALWCPCAIGGEQVDLNRATLAEIEELPITKEQARALWEYREYRAYFSSVYELLELPEIGQEDLDRLKPLVKIVPVPIEDEELQRVNEIYYRIRGWEAEEGASEALVDHWIDLAKDPVNVNTATYWEIANLQNVSPPDAVALYSYSRRNRIDTRSALRNVPGFTYWGYYNTRNFVRYADPTEPAAFRGSYQFRSYDTPSFFDINDCLKEDRNPADGAYDSWWDRLSLGDAGPVYQHKVRARWGRDIRAGALVYRGHGGGDQFDATKVHVTFRNHDVGPIHLDNIIVGNYAVAFGQGLVVQNHR